MSTNKVYELDLPVFKQGDDLAHHIHENAGNVAKAFEAQAEMYEIAAYLCHRMSEVASEHKIKCEADTHRIEVVGPEKVLEALVEESILCVEEYEECPGCEACSGEIDESLN